MICKLPKSIVAMIMMLRSINKQVDFVYNISQLIVYHFVYGFYANLRNSSINRSIISSVCVAKMAMRKAPWGFRPA